MVVRWFKWRYMYVGIARCCEKLVFDSCEVDDPLKVIKGMNDIVRGTIVFDDIYDMVQAVNIITAWHLGDAVTPRRVVPSEDADDQADVINLAGLLDNAPVHVAGVPHPQLVQYLLTDEQGDRFCCCC